VADAVVEESGDWPGDASAGPWLVVGRADAQEVVAATLAERGIRAVTPPAGTMAPSKSQAERLREVLTIRPAHAVVVADPGEARGLLAALDAEERSALTPMALLAVGAATGAALARGGLAPAITLADGSPEAVAGALGSAVRRRCDDGGA
jgi:uroporphyrinogen-III synthase